MSRELAGRQPSARPCTPRSSEDGRREYGEEDGYLSGSTPAAHWRPASPPPLQHHLALASLVSPSSLLHSGSARGGVTRGDRIGLGWAAGRGSRRHCCSRTAGSPRASAYGCLREAGPPRGHRRRRRRLLRRQLAGLNLAGRAARGAAAGGRGRVVLPACLRRGARRRWLHRARWRTREIQ